ncbi:two-component sensor histidine kinase protein [Plesiocystis pacifica SIR-1]|uniref:histidine kinase n=1 Tax=Plesiocystis pacifica SIR-1 TaxID=391625 RepID=A6G2P9_9BACT|nr:PAS domain-containing sensor histidine kinase [Plesiocystis pacifica]EDM79749.1 two-component sensor histidine kinase protein [Plesiocystis pacifica SIR-1]
MTDVQPKLTELAFIDALETVAARLLGSSTLLEGLEASVESFIEVFGCDRVTLDFHRSGGLDLPTTLHAAREGFAPDTVAARDHDSFERRLRVAAESSGEVHALGPGPDPDEEALPSDARLVRECGVQSMLIIAVNPRVGPSWTVSLHYCAAPRSFGLEPRLLALISGRMAEVVTNRAMLEHMDQSEARFRNLFEHAPEGIVVIDLGTLRLVDFNREAEKLFGTPPGELLGAHLRRLLPETTEDGESSEDGLLERVAAASVGEVSAFEWTMQRNGQPFPAELRLVQLPNAERVLVRASIVDITARKALDAKLRQAQKMEAIGQLTGGIAHDFNNLLTVIGTVLEVLERFREDEESFMTELAVAREASAAGSALVQQLLAFSRRKSLRPEVVHLSHELQRSAELLRRTLGSGVVLELALADELELVEVDTAQLITAVLNLCLNARDAMPSKCGTLELRTESLVVESSELAPSPEPLLDVDASEVAGSFVAVRVRDDGSGMSPEMIARVVEPFFTTKSEGKGSGLGLSMVYGFVTQSGGHLLIDSELGVGTTMSLLFPARV